MSARARMPPPPPEAVQTVWTRALRLSAAERPGLGRSRSAGRKVSREHRVEDGSCLAHRPEKTKFEAPVSWRALPNRDREGDGAFGYFFTDSEGAGVLAQRRRRAWAALHRYEAARRGLAAAYRNYQRLVPIGNLAGYSQIDLVKSGVAGHPDIQNIGGRQRHSTKCNTDWRCHLCRSGG